MKLSAILQKIPYPLKIALLIILLSKLLVFSIGYATTYVNDGPAPPLNIIAQEFNRWDAPHYLEIAKNWHASNATEDAYNFIVFFPLYPILIRAVTFDFSYINFSALIISNVTSIIAFIYLYKLTKLDFNGAIAQKAVLFLSVFPTAYFLSAPYTEGLFFATVIASLYYARVCKWPLAGFLSLLAALSRLGGLLMLPVLFVEYWHQKNWKIRSIDPKILCTSLALVGFAIYLGINVQVTGSPFTFMEIQKVHWFNTLDPVKGLENAVYWGFFNPNTVNFQSLTIGISPIVFGAFGLLTIAAAVRLRLRVSYITYMVVTWMLAVSTSWWVSVPRYVMAMFPMFIVLALVSKRKVVTIAISAVFLAGLCFYTVLFALHWWAF